MTNPNERHAVRTKVRLQTVPLPDYLSSLFARPARVSQLPPQGVRPITDHISGDKAPALNLLLLVLGLAPSAEVAMRTERKNLAHA